MAGIYIHIPFCRQRCHYCDFFTTTQINRKPELIHALIQEMILRKDWLEGDPVKTIYFGGGTPSVLSVEEINAVFEAIFKNFVVIKNPEITIEANPDDLSYEYLQQLKTTKVNRLSIGIQSFHETDLVLMKRRHTAKQTIDCVQQAQEVGFNNISVDLIYGLPESTHETWQQNLEQVSNLKIQHLSAYHLTYEKGTVFDVWSKKGKIIPVKEEESISQFNQLIEWAPQNNMVHYEISNFGLEGFFSEHNSSYWKQEKYLGIGPAAHSYNLESRAWNPSNIQQYIEGIITKKPKIEFETLSSIDKYNEFLITSLRTHWGIVLDELEKQFGAVRKDELIKKVKVYIDNNKINLVNGNLVLTHEGIFISDSILTELIEDLEE